MNLQPNLLTLVLGIYGYQANAEAPKGYSWVSGGSRVHVISASHLVSSIAAMEALLWALKEKWTEMSPCPKSCSCGNGKD